MTNSTPQAEQNMVELAIDGMHCVSCAAGIEARLRKLGVDDVKVNFATGLSTIEYRSPLTEAEIVKTIKLAGFQPKISNSATPTIRSPFTSLETKFLLSLLGTVPLVSAMFLPWPLLHDPYLQLALCLPVFLMGFFHFGRSAISSLRTKTPNMDVLITLGISSSFGYSLYGTVMELGHKFLFYETAATIISLVLLGNLLEKRSVRKTTSAIEELSQLQPETAKLIDNDSAELKIREIAVNQIKIGDQLLVNSGDRIPVDGQVFWGHATVNESILSGESIPQEKEPTKQVYGGSLVEHGSIKIKATAVGSATTIAQIIQLVRSARSRRPQIQKLGDQIASIFVPIVLAIAVATLALSFLLFGLPFDRALINSVAVLVIACPCAMGLATPTAVMVGLGRAAKAGILIKGGDTVEQFAKIDKVIFDKTGTLTTGQFEIKAIEAFKYDREKIESILLTLEQHSSHPIAKSVAKALAAATPYQLFKFEQRKGAISGQDGDGNRYQLGGYAVAKELTTDKDHELYLLENGELIATIDIKDSVKPESRQVIEALKQIGIEPIMLSGDREEVCQAVAQELGITNYQSRVLPEEKLVFLEELLAKAHTAFVGDGVNDAPALSRATVGVSLSDANQVAINSAQVILLDGNLERLLKALEISRLTLRTIKQNLFWAFFYNVCAIPVAAVGLLNPMIAAAAMAFSDILVIGNSIWLKTKRISGKQELLKESSSNF